MNARQWRATSKAPYRANQFGGSLGGPIIKNKAFFFVDYQGLLLSNGISYILTVPTDLMTQGTFLKSQFPNPIYDPTTKAQFPTVSTPQGECVADSGESLRSGFGQYGRGKQDLAGSDQPVQHQQQLQGKHG